MFTNKKIVTLSQKLKKRIYQGVMPMTKYVTNYVTVTFFFLPTRI